MVLSTTAIVLVVIVTIEVAIIVVGNLFTIFAFWTQRLRLKRTFLLVINLAVADLFVGLGETLVLAANTIPNGGNEILKIESPWWAFQVFGSSTSLTFLTLISLERVYSVLWPFRHRATSTRAYVYSIVFAYELLRENFTIRSVSCRLWFGGGGTDLSRRLVCCLVCCWFVVVCFSSGKRDLARLFIRLLLKTVLKTNGVPFRIVGCFIFFLIKKYFI